MISRKNYNANKFYLQLDSNYIFKFIHIQITNSISAQLMIIESKVHFKFKDLVVITNNKAAHCDYDQTNLYI